MQGIIPIREVPKIKKNDANNISTNIILTEVISKYNHMQHTHIHSLPNFERINTKSHNFSKK